MKTLSAANNEETIESPRVEGEEEENLPLENEWCFWFDKGQKNRTGGGKESYLSRLKNMGKFGTVMVSFFHI